MGGGEVEKAEQELDHNVTGTIRTNQEISSQREILTIDGIVCSIQLNIHRGTPENAERRASPGARAALMRSIRISLRALRCMPLLDAAKFQSDDQIAVNHS